VTHVWLLAAAALVLALTIWGGRVVRDQLGFFVASRSAGAWLVGLGGTAAGLSAFVFVGGPGLFATVGVASLWIILSAPFTGALQCWAVGERVVEVCRRTPCHTIPELLSVHYPGRSPKAVAAVVIVVGATATLAVQIKGLAVLGEVLLGVDGIWVAIGAIGATVAYTTAGGMRAGIIAEAVQGGIMALAAGAIAAAALIAVGGPVEAWTRLGELRPALLEPWGTVGPERCLGWFFLFALGTCAQPHYLQKFLLLRSARSLRWLPAIMTGALVAVLAVWVAIGLSGATLLATGTLLIEHPDQVTPALLQLLGSPTLTVLAVVAVGAAVMSTAATLLSLISAAAVRDLPAALASSSAPLEEQSLWPARLVTVLAGAASATIALASSETVVWLGILGWGLFTAALLPTVVIGFHWSGVRPVAGAAAMVTGAGVHLTLTFTAPGAIEPGLTGAAAGTVVLVAGSLATPSRRRHAVDT
jgi:Na+/proline symporter